MITALALALTLTASPSPTHEQVASIGRDLETNFARGVDGLTPMLDADALVRRTLAGLEAPEDFRRGFTKGFKSTAGMLGGAMLAQAKAGARITFRKTVTLEGQPAVQLRMLTPDGSFNVFELIVQPNASGDLRVIDLYDLVGGELKSVEIRRMALAGLAEMDRNVVDRLLGKEKVFIKNLPRLKSISTAMREGRFEDVMKEFKALPRELQAQRSYLRMYATAAFKVDEKEYERALARYLALFPNDPSSHVMAIDFYFLKKKWAQLEKAITLVERRVGADDAWFEVLRANSQEAQGHREAAKKHLVTAIAREKTLTDPYFMLIGFALMEKNHADTAKWLTAIVTDAHVELHDVSGVPEYAAFSASKEGQAFLKQQRAASAK